MTSNKRFTMDYKTPSYLTQAANLKFGRHIHIMGVTGEELQQFWNQMRPHIISSEKPERKSDVIVDIKTKCIANASETSNIEHEKESSLVTTPEVDMLYDEVEITNKERSGNISQKIFTLKLENESSPNSSDTVDLLVNGTGYFNTSAGPIALKTKNGTDASAVGITGDEGALDKECITVEKIKIPPKMKLTAKIITKAVTYEVKTVSELRISAKAYVPLRYKGRLEKKLGRFCSATIHSVTAEELLCNEKGFRLDGGDVVFVREGTVSYVGEETEIIKYKEKIM